MRSSLLLGATAASLIVLSGSAFAATFDYSSYNVVNNLNVQIAAGPLNGLSTNGTYGSGQIDLTGAGANLGQTLYTWCIDAFHDLQGNGLYNIVSPPLNNAGGDSRGTAISASTLGQIGALMTYGDAHIADNYFTSSAVQIAIWDTEYAGLGYSFTSGDSNVTGLVSTLLGEVGSWNPVNNVQEVIALNNDGHAINQGLGYISAVPLPGAAMMFGASLLALGGFGWKARQKKTA